MLQALRDLATAQKEGLLSEEEYEKQHTALLAGDQRWGTSPTPDRIAAVESKLDRLTDRLLPPDKTSTFKTAKAPTPKYKTVDGSVLYVQPVPREEGQRSVLSMGVTVQEQRKDGRINFLRESQIRKPVANVFRCSFQGCGRCFTRPAGLACHEKTHKQAGAVKKARSILEMASMRAKLSTARREHEDKVVVRSVLNELIAAVSAQGVEPTKKDGRAKNKGTQVRQPRSAAFRLKVASEYEKYCKQYPAIKADIAGFVGDLYSVSSNQVHTWYRTREAILKQFKLKANRNNCRMRRKKGRFEQAEQKLYELFLEERKACRRVGPRWLMRTAKKQVDALDPPHPLAPLFRARRGWLRRFTKRFSIALRRKSNAKKVPIEQRVPFLQRWFAVFRLFLRSSHNHIGYTPRWGIYKHRWSLDQVPAGTFDPKQTYEVKGAKRVCIAANDAFDKHRWATLQILVGNFKISGKPRHGQPKLVICFRGTGVRISEDEKSQYHDDIIVMFQAKAWYDGLTCNKWVMDAAATSILKEDLNEGERHLILCDNLNGQTRKCNPQFLSLLDKMCSCDVWNLLAGNTDEIQVVDAGFGKLVKDLAEDEACDWMNIEANWLEWTGPRITASRKRILITHWYAAAYETACERFDFVSVFDKTGSNLSADGSGDSEISLQGVPAFSFTLEDAKRDCRTGELAGANAAATEVTEANAAACAAVAAADSGDEEGDPEEATENSQEEEEGGSTSDEDLEGPDFELDVDVHVELPSDYPACVIGKTIYHRYDEGWYPGMVLRQITMSTITSRNGKFAIKFEDSASEIDQALKPYDYGGNGHWLLVK